MLSWRDRPVLGRTLTSCDMPIKGRVITGAPRGAGWHTVEPETEDSDAKGDLLV
jgi:hypothetical protein